MAITPSGPLSLPLTNLQTILANCATFQEWVGADNAEAAKARIYLVAVDEGSYIRPYALVAQGDEWKRELSAGGAGHVFQPSGNLFLMFEANVSEAYQSDHRDAELEFTNKIGTIIKEMEALAGQSGYLTVNYINYKEEGPSRSSEDERETQGDFYQVILEVGWGV